MDYQKFYGEIVEWIKQSNQMAIKHGLESDEFWRWVMNSSGELCDKYGNTQLVMKQMLMLIDWLEEVFLERKGVQG